MLYVGTGWMRWMGWEGIGYRWSLVYKTTCGAKKKEEARIWSQMQTVRYKSRRPDRIRLREMCFPKSKTELEDYIAIQLTKTFMGLNVLFKVQSDRLLHKVRLKLTIEKIILEVNVLLMKFIWL